jgi:hypothetical protein
MRWVCCPAAGKMEGITRGYTPEGHSLQNHPTKQEDSYPEKHSAGLLEALRLRIRQAILVTGCHFRRAEHLFDLVALWAHPKLHSDTKIVTTLNDLIDRQYDLYPRLRWPGEPGTQQAQNGPPETP